MGILDCCGEKPKESLIDLNTSAKDSNNNKNRTTKLLESTQKIDLSDPEYSSNLGNSNLDYILEKRLYSNNKDINSKKEEESKIEGQGEEKEKVIKEGQGEEQREGEEGGQVEEQKEGQIDIQGKEEEKEDDEEKILEDYNNALGDTVGQTKVINPNLVNQEIYQKPNQQNSSSINIYKSTASNQGAVDLNNIQAISSGNGNEIIYNNIQQESAISNIGNNENIQNISAVPVTNNNNDFKQYTNNGNVGVGIVSLPIGSTVPAPTEIDLNNCRIKETGNFYYSNYNVGGVNLSSNNVDINNRGYNYVNTHADNA